MLGTYSLCLPLTFHQAWLEYVAAVDWSKSVNPALIVLAVASTLEAISAISLYVSCSRDIAFDGMGRHVAHLVHLGKRVTPS
jgi:hypothetical protein